MEESNEPVVVKEDDLHGRTVEHPAFGMIRAGRVTGRANLFMVDYPQDHYITLTISQADLRRDLSRDWVHAKRFPLVEISLSEVQWARLVSSLNTEGVPCTLTHYAKPKSAEFERPKMPENHIGKAPTLKKEVQEAGRKAAESVNEALKDLDAMLSGGPVKKGDLKLARDKVWQAARKLSDSIPYTVSQAEEAIETAVESAKAELSAYAEHTMQRLGRMAIAERIEATGDVKIALLSEKPTL